MKPGCTPKQTKTLYFYCDVKQDTVAVKQCSIVHIIHSATETLTEILVLP
jgi:hypothetical protein